MRFATVLALLMLTSFACGGESLHQVFNADQCGSCHADQHREWRASAHAQSDTSPVFQAMLPKVEAAWGPVARAQCVACHAPAFGEDRVIGCVACHAAIGNQGEANGALVVKPAGPLSARTPTHAPHQVEARSFLTSDSLCGTCHEVHGPGLLDEPTLTEFRNSPAAGGEGCLQCHGATGHELQGFSLMSRALTLSATNGAVTLTNTGAGHAVPTGIAAVRDVWVDVIAVDGDGREVVVERVLTLGARLTRAGAEVALMTDADHLESRALAPGETRRWPVPAGLRVRRAVLKALPVRAEALEALGLPESVAVEVAVAP